MKYAFHKIKLTDIDGKELQGEEFFKLLAQTLYKFANSLNMVQVALDMNKRLEVDLTEAEVQEIKEVVTRPDINFAAFARKTLFEFLDKPTQTVPENKPKANRKK